jgi:hypothetical protein
MKLTGDPLHSPNLPSTDSNTLQDSNLTICTHHQAKQATQHYSTDTRTANGTALVVIPVPIQFQFAGSASLGQPFNSTEYLQQHPRTDVGPYLPYLHLHIVPSCEAQVTVYSVIRAYVTVESAKPRNTNNQIQSSFQQTPQAALPSESGQDCTCN